MASSFNTTGSLSSSPQLGIVKNTAGILNQSNIGAGLTLPPTPGQTVSNPLSGASQPSKITPGLIANTASSNTHTTTTNPTTGATVTKPTPNKSVLAQQQMLNKQYGAGLVEDGLAGPKTSAAVAKYLNSGSSSTSTPQADYDNVTGLLTSAGKTKGLAEVNAPKTTASAGVLPPKESAPLTVSGQIPGVLNAGAPTSWEQSAKDGSYVNDAVLALSKFQRGTADKIADIKSDAIPLEFQQGRAQVVQQASAEKEKALQQGVANALTNQGQQLNAAGTQASRGLSAAESTLGAVAPVTGVPYGTQTIQPGLLGSTGGVSVDPNNPVASIPSLAQSVANGQMTIDQANTALGNNIGLTTQLRNSILQSNPNFNFTQSSASAATQATGQVLKASAESANQALDKLQSDFGTLSWWQTQGFPITNDIATTIANKLGQTASSTYTTTLHDARAQLQGVLSASGAVTPTGAEEMAKVYLPDGMTPEQLPAKIAAAKALVLQKLQAFQNSGVQNNSSTSTSSGGDSIWNF